MAAFPVIRELQLAPELQRALTSKFELIRYEKGDFVYKMGQVAGEMYFVFQGYVVESEGAVHGPGSFFGELGVLSTSNNIVERSMNCQVTSASCILFRLLRSDLLEFLGQYSRYEKRFKMLSQCWTEKRKCNPVSMVYQYI